jgi:hypothetical protein
MPSYSKNDIILVRYPFSDLSSSVVVRCAVRTLQLESVRQFNNPELLLPPSGEI